MVRSSSFLVPRGFAAITLFPFIILRSDTYKNDKKLILHERIHLAQQKELLVIPFFLMYSTEFLVRLVFYRSRKKAYRNISFEREAYANETNPQYLHTRKPYSFLKYL